MKTEPTGLIPGTTEELGRVKAGVHTPDSLMVKRNSALGPPSDRVCFIPHPDSTASVHPINRRCSPNHLNV